MSSPQAGDARATAERMEALGRLAGGVAHDLNNVLMIISGYAEVLAQSVADEDATEAVQIIQDAAGRAGALTRQLLLFSRRQTVESAEIAIAPAIHSLETGLRRLLPEDVTLVVLGGDPRLVARVDRGHLDQLVVDLVTYARDAMSGAGRLTVSVLGGRRDAFVDASGEQAPEGDYVRVSVSHTGAGLEEAVRRRIFEPFFTLKPAGKGAGLRLAAVYGIVKSSGGFIDVTSAPGCGSTFEICFPVAAQAAATDRLVADANRSCGGETILPADRNTVATGSGEVAHR